MAEPATLAPKRLGNMYTASLYAGLVSLINSESSRLEGKRVLMFSYGSGLASSMFSLRVQASAGDLAKLRAVINLNSRLNSCIELSPQQFANVCCKHTYLSGL
jgi:hydroxymethylglutaryl-CoA synthase